MKFGYNRCLRCLKLSYNENPVSENDFDLLASCT